ncbi:FecR family protein [Steroidobacter sp.]|uniref:FecR family protein n=1 Tax=Steroidobacter sp. TaxID=1978227 RepID=UPI001A4DFA3A|nr:FecR domain-containing protein [Steroidobacter sp.]MBL8269823.1 FecR domain-containing protein [Steroidobacter sp.]
MSDNNRTGQQPPDRADEAAEAFVGCLQEQRAGHEQASLERSLAEDPALAEAFGSVADTWQSLGDHAKSPEFMALREQALARARLANSRRWSRPIAAGFRGWRGVAAAVVLLAVLVSVQLSPLGYWPGQYRTGIGEQRTVELDDHSQITLDAVTRLRVSYTDQARIVYLGEGQAQFSVARDPLRPFRVVAGDRTIIALGTVFTVEVVDRQVRVAMLEGKVAVLPTEAAKAMPARAPSTVTEAEHAHSNLVELTTGEALYVKQDGSATLVPHADLDAATAWRQGRIVFNKTPLAEAVLRLNRYSRWQLRIDSETLETMKISGVFTAGDTAAFAEAVQLSLPIVADHSAADTISLRARSKQ